MKYFMADTRLAGLERMMMEDREALEAALAGLDYRYSPERNQFI